MKVVDGNIGYHRLTITSMLVGIFSSCASIREVKKSPGKGGEIMIQEGIGGDARADAKQVMKENCGAKSPVIVEEGEAVIGTKHHAGKHFGESEDKREWRIKYRCKKKKTG